MTPQEYRQYLRQTSQKSSSRVGKLWLAPAVVISRAEFVQVAASLVAAYSQQAAMLGDNFMSERLRKQPLGIGRPPDDVGRLEKALAKILHTGPDDSLPRVERLARAEPLSAAQSASREVLVRAEVAEYVFDTDENPCGLCAWRASQTWPVNTAAIAHPGCTCILLPKE